MILDISPEAPLEHTLSYLVDTIISHDGTEQRIAIRKQPRQSFSGTVVYPTEEDLRRIREDLYFHTVSTVYFPLWHEGVRITSQANSGQNTISADFSKCDFAVGELVYIVHKNQTTIDIKPIATKSDSAITTTGNLASTFPAGSKVYPLEDVFIGDQPGITRFPRDVGQLQLEVTMRRQPTLPGHGAAALSTYTSIPVLDQRPILSGSTYSQIFDRNMETIETENAFWNSSPTDYASSIAAKIFTFKSAAERQRWKLFFYTIGAVGPFWVPTWEANLELDSQPGASTSFDILDTPDYVTNYFNTGAIWDFQFELADGTVIYRTAESAIDNGNGTQTVTVTSALPATAITKISFMEKCRLGTAQVSFTHYGANRGEVKLSVASLKGVEGFIP